MDEYDLPYPDEEDNFEDQYADELEVLNDIGGGIDRIYHSNTTSAI